MWQGMNIAQILLYHTGSALFVQTVLNNIHTVMSCGASQVTSQEWVLYFRLYVHVQYHFKMGLAKERLI